ncbi:hypothetical protein [Mammaliicoccus sp. E-M24]|uniref:hypothetical protein n=1 Tax=Mammaliicoccus sp. E-M24 TaxID=2898684 RepID=UPI001EFA8D5D|nr:hypothetical protein [Mammaliicoccus sp. E-M24]
MNTTIRKINGNKIKEVTTFNRNKEIYQTTNFYWLFGQSEIEIEIMSISYYDNSDKEIYSQYGIIEHKDVITDDDINTLISSLDFQEIYIKNQEMIYQNLVDLQLPKNVNGLNLYYEFYNVENGKHETFVMIDKEDIARKIATVYAYDGTTSNRQAIVQYQTNKGVQVKEYADFNTLDDIVTMFISEL